MTAGFRSTEFWLASVVAALGGLCVALAIAGREGLVWPGVALLAAALFAYGHVVGKRKAQRPYLPPIGKI